MERVVDSCRKTSEEEELRNTMWILSTSWKEHNSFAGVAFGELFAITQF